MTDPSASDQQDEKEQSEVESRSAPSGKIVYKAILREGEEELKRPTSALFWSALAAGLSMGCSLISEALLRAHLPDAPWRPLVTKLGYSIGFLIVILGRQQLFTENTLTPILPLLKAKSVQVLGNVARLWAIVLLANLIGALAMSFAIVRTGALDHDVKQAVIDIGRESMQHAFLVTMWRGVFAGWLIALMVWLLPFAETARVGVIIIITYVVGLGHFAHIIAGAVNAFGFAWAGEASWSHVIGTFLIPTLIGNCLGGVTLVAALNHAQVVAGGGGEDV